MSALISTEGGRYLRDEAERMASALQSGDSDWKYTAAPAPGNCGLYCIEVRERDGALIGRFGQ
jgi:hypothetical protein